MPISPTYPGVYVQEIPSGVRTITSVATSIAAFLGRTTKGPINKAVRILSLADYERQFGEPYSKSSLAQSVQQFFNNGGTDCYVVRLAKDPDLLPGKDLFKSRPSGNSRSLWINPKIFNIGTTITAPFLMLNTFSCSIRLNVSTPLISSPCNPA